MKFELTNNNSLEDLQSLNFWQPKEKVLKTSELPDSNMNQVIRIHTNQRTVIAKQSRDFVRKFPQIPAPIQRIETEKKFYETVQESEFLNQYSPKIISWLPKDYLLITEDLGGVGDFSGLYSGEKQIGDSEIKSLIDYLNYLHRLAPENFPDNLEMRVLNHEHIFNFPFEIENGFDLNTIQKGLQELSLRYKKDYSLKQKIHDLGKRYLAPGSSLLHGDFYPGSWMSGNSVIKIIDPEFAFVGDREFDLGVFLAHADFAEISTQVERALAKYYSQDIDSKLVQGYRGVEIMRRLIGIAQLPLKLNLGQKEVLLERAKEMIMNP